MRHWIMSLAVVLFTVVCSESQETKKKDTDPGKESKAEPTEPTEYLGKSFDAWRKDITSDDPSKREMAMKAMLMFGLPKATEAMPDIIADLARHKNTPLDLSVRVNGVMALNTYFLHASKGKGPDPGVVKAALPVYKMFLKDSQVIMKERAVQGLQYMGTPARELLNDVIPLVRDGSTWELRKEAIPVMVSLASNEKGPGDAKAIAALRKSIDRDIEKSYVVRALAVQGLGVLGKDTVLVDLKKAMNDPAKEVRLAAVQAMAVGPKEKALLPLKDALADKAKEVRVAAVQCYGFAGQASAMPELRNLLDHTEKEMRLQTLNTIVNLKQHVYPKLQPKDLTLKKLEQRAMEETDPIVYIWVHATIMTVTDNIDKKHISPVLQKLKHKDAQVRVEALKVIAMCQDKARPFAYQAVLDAIDDKELNVAGPAIETLVHMRAYDAIPRLKLLMEDKKAPEALKEVAENAVDNLELLKGREKKDKSDKKTP